MVVNEVMGNNHRERDQDGGGQKRSIEDVVENMTARLEYLLDKAEKLEKERLVVSRRHLAKHQGSCGDDFRG